VSSDTNFAPTLQEIKQSTNYYGFEEKLETGDIDATKWTETTAGTGTRTTEYFYLKFSTGANAGGIAALETKQRQPIVTDIVNTSRQFKKFILEFSGALNNLASTDNTTFMLGLAQNASSTRSSNYVIGWILAGDVLTALADRGGVELTETIDVTGITLSSWNTYRIEITNKTIQFFINGVLKATITTVSALSYAILNFYVKSDAAVDVIDYIVGVRAWFE